MNWAIFNPKAHALPIQSTSSTVREKKGRRDLVSSRTQTDFQKTGFELVLIVTVNEEQGAPSYSQVPMPPLAAVTLFALHINTLLEIKL